jgi:hypothetical protein
VILLIAAELLRGTRIPRRAVVLVGLILVFGSVANFRRLQEGADLLHDSSSHVAAELAAVQLAAQHVDPDYQPDPVRAPAIRAGPYLEAVDELGSPADTPNEVLARPEPVRQAADGVLIHALRIGPFRARPLTAATTPRVVSAEGKVERRAPCVVFRPSGAPSSVELRTEADLVVGNEGNTAAEYRLRSFADGYPPAASGTLAAESRQTLPLGRGQHARPWWILVTAYGPVEFCTAA